MTFYIFWESNGSSCGRFYVTPIFCSEERHVSFELHNSEASSSLVSAEVQLSYKCRILVQFEILSDKLDEEDILEYVVSEIICTKQKNKVHLSGLLY